MGGTIKDVLTNSTLRLVMDLSTEEVQGVHRRLPPEYSVATYMKHCKILQIFHREITHIRLARDSKFLASIELGRKSRLSDVSFDPA